MDEWLTSARDKLAEATNTPVSELELTDAAVASLLEIAGHAAHESGDRRNAPLLCYLIGRADQGGDLERLCSAVTAPRSRSR
jgi:hypothetical protein